MQMFRDRKGSKSLRFRLICAFSAVRLFFATNGQRPTFRALSLFSWRLARERARERPRGEEEQRLKEGDGSRAGTLDVDELVLAVADAVVRPRCQAVTAVARPRPPASACLLPCPAPAPAASFSSFRLLSSTKSPSLWQAGQPARSTALNRNTGCRVLGDRLLSLRLSLTSLSFADGTLGTVQSRQMELNRLSLGILLS